MKEGCSPPIVTLSFKRAGLNIFPGKLASVSVGHIEVCEASNEASPSSLVLLKLHQIYCQDNEWDSSLYSIFPRLTGDTADR